MLRNLFRFLVLIVIVALARYVIAWISRAITGPQPGPNASRTPAAQSTGELKRDPVCGTFVASSSSVKKNVDGEVIHFCSDACRDKYLVA